MSATSQPEPAQDVPAQTGTPAPDVNMKPSEDAADDADDDLFGDDDNDGDASETETAAQQAKHDLEDEDADDDEEAIRPSNRRAKRPVGSQSPAASPTDEARTGLPTFDDDEPDEDEEARAAEIAALEYEEDGQPMGRADGRSASPPSSKLVAGVALANVAQRFTPSHLARLPLFLKVDSKGYDETSYKEERRAAAEEEKGLDDRLKDVERRLRCDNTVRWQAGANGKRRSNTRFVRWSDGSWTLQVGKEQFDVAGFDSRYAGSKDVQINEASQAASGSQSQQGAGQGLSQSQPVKVGGSSSSKAKGGGGTSKSSNEPLTYIATPDERTGLLQTISPLYSNVSIQPASLQSATHRLISQNLSSIRARESAAKVTMSDLVTGERAPEEVKRERERKLLDEERKRRLRKKKEQGGDIEAEEEAELAGLLKGRRRTMIEDVAKTSKGSRGLGGGRKAGVSTALDEDDEEGEEVGGYMEEDGDADGFIVNDEDEEDADGEEDSGAEEDEEAEGNDKASKKRRNKADSEDMDIDEELDDMEKAEMEIERQNAERSKAKKDAAAAAAAAGGTSEATPVGDEAGDGAAQRRKKAIVDSDDDDDE